jgi:hypothetical protein
MHIKKLSLSLTLVLASASAWASLGGKIFCDGNCNGVLDTNEVGLAGVTVNAYLCGTDTLVGSTVSGPDGSYSFSPTTTMPVGSTFYTCVTLPTGYGPGPNNPGFPCTTTCFTFAEPCDCIHDIGICPLTVSCPSPIQSPGTGTPGYWANHPNAWPTNQLVIGGITYTKAAAIKIIKRNVAGDKRYTIFPSLVSAELNVLIGNDSSCVDTAIEAANAWWATYSASPVAAKSAAWKLIAPEQNLLDAYNNGLLCAPHRN